LLFSHVRSCFVAAKIEPHLSGQTPGIERLFRQSRSIIAPRIYSAACFCKTCSSDAGVRLPLLLQRDSAFEKFLSLIDQQPCAIWIIEQLQLSGFESKAVMAGARWFSAFKARRGAELIFVSHVPGARMVAASLAFAAHMKISNCNTLSEAYARAGIAKF